MQQLPQQSIPDDRKSRRAALDRQEIMEAAMQLFAEHGYHNVSMQEISRKARFGLGTIYKFFKNKEGLYKAIVEEKAAECHRRQKEALRHRGDVIKRLEAYLKAKTSFLEENADFARLYLFETQGSRFSIRGGMEKGVKELHDEIVSMLTDLFEEGMEKKRFRPEFSPRMLAVALEGLSNGIMVDWLEHGCKPPSPTPEELLSMFLGEIEAAPSSSKSYREVSP